MELFCPVSLGEILDKISILRIKKLKITCEVKRAKVIFEEKRLLQTLKSINLSNMESWIHKLFVVNLKLWEVEDEIRIQERDASFGEYFIKLARSVYKFNDQRFQIKNEINQLYGSSIQEVKSYESY